MCAAHGEIDPLRSSEETSKKPGGTAQESIAISVEAAAVLLWLLSLIWSREGRARVEISTPFPPPFVQKTKAGYVSRAADTKAPPDFALSSSALFSNLHRKSRTRTPVFHGIATAGSVTTR